MKFMKNTFTFFVYYRKKCPKRKILLTDDDEDFVPTKKPMTEPSATPKKCGRPRKMKNAAKYNGKKEYANFISIY